MPFRQNSDYEAFLCSMTGSTDRASLLMLVLKDMIDRNSLARSTCPAVYLQYSPFSSLVVRGPIQAANAEKRQAKGSGWNVRIRRVRIIGKRAA